MAQQIALRQSERLRQGRRECPGGVEPQISDRCRRVAAERRVEFGAEEGIGKDRAALNGTNTRRERRGGSVVGLGSPWEIDVTVNRYEARCGANESSRNLRCDLSVTPAGQAGRLPRLSLVGGPGETGIQ